ncbi:IPExxxVDY family protein [Putridiphycobacter roseus]|uniref:IPExxxVDY family protein n=1 Tax=Putridiphycobacter roseus TaxID=2219161 RepID=A0A2W1NU17_9FLAO|nr:IPExxxVDY family protein [Putridiphycobacter roseus]PZE18258.1 IPExxxVDY family protein [Putridiphycobacter roseus]
MAKHKLFLEEEYNFDLIGICCSHSDYRLCWAMNSALEINLSKSDDYYLKNKKDGEYYFSFYEYTDEETFQSYYLLKNLSFDNYKRLIPEQDQIDYFLIIKDNYDLILNDFLTRLKKIDCILTAFNYDPEQLKSKANLLF